MASWTVRHLPPLVASIGLLVSALVFSLWWNVHIDHNTVWYEPADLWRTMLAAVRLDHGQLGGLYTDGTNLVSFPGAAILLAPAAAVISAMHAPLGPPIGVLTDTNAWLVALPYIVVVSTSVLFAADRLAVRMGARMAQRIVLAVAGAVAVWNVVPYWGHPEDCVAVALALFAVDAAAAGRRWRSAWLMGLGLAVQPLVLLAVPVLAVVAGGRQLVGWLARAAIPPAVAVGAALAANWSATWYQVVDQPNWPTIDRPTPWLGLAPHLTSQTVAAGPGRSIAVVLAVLAAIPAWRAWRRAEQRANAGAGTQAGTQAGAQAGDRARARADAPVPTASSTGASSLAAVPLGAHGPANAWLGPPASDPAAADWTGAWLAAPAAATGGAAAPRTWHEPPGNGPAMASTTGGLPTSGSSVTAHRASPMTPVTIGWTERATRWWGHGASRSLPWSTAGLTAVVWWVALALALRCGFESVMVSYYIWPGIAVGMLAASAAWSRLLPTALVGVGLTLFCNVWWHGEWSWWSVIVVGLAILLLAAHPGAQRTKLGVPDDPVGGTTSDRRFGAVGGVPIDVSIVPDLRAPAR